jgi:hypothetical protein
MKNFKKLFGIITLVVIIGFLMVSCETETDNDIIDGLKWRSDPLPNLGSS